MAEIYTYKLWWYKGTLYAICKMCHGLKKAYRTDVPNTQIPEGAEITGRYTDDRYEDRFSVRFPCPGCDQKGYVAVAATEPVPTAESGLDNAFDEPQV